jgi:hydroxymethylpyrimidine/phosphomethylpyrimidine kinase
MAPTTVHDDGRQQVSTPPKALTIAGSDSGGAAGLQADLKTFTALGVYGLTVVTAVTAQNSLRVVQVHPVPVDMVAAQIDAVLSDYGAAAVKTGYLGRVEIVEIVAAGLKAHHPRFVVVDPVLVNHLGQPMFEPSVARAYAEHLLPLADLVTPNLAEAALLAGTGPVQPGELEDIARALLALGASNVLLKGSRAGEQMVDLLVDGRGALALGSPWLDTPHTHGSGDTLSAAACAYLALGRPARLAVQLAHAYTAEAIRRGSEWRMGGGHGPVAHW